MPQPGPPEGPRGLSPSSGRKDRRRRKHREAGGRRRKTQAAMREGAADAAKQERSLWVRGSQMQVGRIRRLCRAGRQTPLSRSPPNKLRQAWRNRGAGVPRNDCRRCSKTQAGRPETEGDAAMRRTESRLGGSAARRLGGSAARRLGGSAARRLGGSAAHYSSVGIVRDCQAPGRTRRTRRTHFIVPDDHAQRPQDPRSRRAQRVPRSVHHVHHLASEHVDRHDPARNAHPCRASPAPLSRTLS